MASSRRSAATSGCVRPRRGGSGTRSSTSREVGTAAGIRPRSSRPQVPENAPRGCRRRSQLGSHPHLPILMERSAVRRRVRCLESPGSSVEAYVPPGHLSLTLSSRLERADNHGDSRPEGAEPAPQPGPVRPGPRTEDRGPRTIPKLPPAACTTHVARHFDALAVMTGEAPGGPLDGSSLAERATTMRQRANFGLA